MDDLKRLVAEYGAFWVIIIGVVCVKMMWSEAKASWKDWIRHLSVALLVGGLMNMYLADIPDETLGVGSKGVILGLVVLQADHLFLGLLNLGHRFKEDPAGSLRAILSVWRGGK